MSPPETEVASWGRGRSPQPLPSRPSWGWGEHRDRAATSASPRLPIRVTCQPPFHRHGAGFPEGSGSQQGAKGAAWPRPFSTDPKHPNAAASHPHPAVLNPIPLSRAVRAQHGCRSPGTCTAQAQRVRPAWGRGKSEVGGESGSAQASAVARRLGSERRVGRKRARRAPSRLSSPSPTAGIAGRPEGAQLGSRAGVAWDARARSPAGAARC